MTAAANIESVSAWSMPSGAHRFGYTRRDHRGDDARRARRRPRARADPTSQTVRRAEQARPEQVREHALHPEHRRDREEDDVQRRVLGRGAVQALLDEERRDEALAVGEQVRARVVEERVAVRVEVAAVREHVRDAQRERGDDDAARARTGTNAGRVRARCGRSSIGGRISRFRADR